MTDVVHRPAGTGPMTWAMGSLFEHVLTGAESAGALGLALVTHPPGTATPLHRHTHEAEGFSLLDGTMTYRAGEEDFHRPVRFLGMSAPGGLLRLYDDVGVPAAERRLPGEDGQSTDVEIPRWNEVAPGYGLEVLGPPLPQEADR